MGSFCDRASVHRRSLRDTRYYVEDGSIVSYALPAAAWDYGLGTCWIAGDKPLARSLPAQGARHDAPGLLIALGYPAQPWSRNRSIAWYWEKW